MEAETIIYYHPMPEQSSEKCAAKRHWWQDGVLQEQILPAKDSRRLFTLVDCPVPPFYYRAKAWKPEDLSESMEAVLHRTPGMADAYLHPDIMTQVSEMYADRWETCRETMEMLLACLLADYASLCLRKQGQVAVLLGAQEDTQWQMGMTWRLIEPYLDRINDLLFCYEKMGETDIREELSPHLDAYYYEYGLVPQLAPYRTGQKRVRCGRQKCEGVILDYGSNVRCPEIAPGRRSIYVDMASCQEKERACTRKDGQVLYVSPLKYLDTMVKNSYDRLVH